MKSFGSFRLLTKTVWFYLIFVLAAFSFSGHYIVMKANQYVNKETEDIFEKREFHLQKYLEQNDTLKSWRTTSISVVNDLSDSLNYPQYSDTVIYLEEFGEDKLFRQKVFLIKSGEKFYRVKTLVSIGDFTKFQDDVVRKIIIAFVVLALIIIFFNVIISGYLFKPFHRILEKMDKYKVGKGTVTSDISSSTLEFKKMNLLFLQMVERTESDYKKLKEYTENMAHEIQTPLTIIRNKTEKLISDESVMETHKDSVKVIYDETNHLSKLGTTLNLLTKIENGEYTDVIHINTEPVVLKHVDSITELTELKSLKIETKLNQEHHILIDPFLLDIILKNLLRNAVRYASNEGAIKIETTISDLCISNFGDELKVKENKIFERFYTSNNSNQSLGLGLSLVKRICDLNNLDITYQYADNQHKFSISNKF